MVYLLCACAVCSAQKSSLFEFNRQRIFWQKKLVASGIYRWHTKWWITKQWNAPATPTKKANSTCRCNWIAVWNCAIFQWVFFPKRQTPWSPVYVWMCTPFQTIASISSTFSRSPSSIFIRMNLSFYSCAGARTPTPTHIAHTLFNGKLTIFLCLLGLYNIEWAMFWPRPNICAFLCLPLKWRKVSAHKHRNCVCVCVLSRCTRAIKMKNGQ